MIFEFNLHDLVKHDPTGSVGIIVSVTTLTMNVSWIQGKIAGSEDLYFKDDPAISIMVSKWSKKK